MQNPCLLRTREAAEPLPHFLIVETPDDVARDLRVGLEGETPGLFEIFEQVFVRVHRRLQSFLVEGAALVTREEIERLELPFDFLRERFILGELQALC